MQDQSPLAMTSLHSQTYDKNISRRSVDWRDSGIVIDEDFQLNSLDSICNSFSARTNIEFNACSVERMAINQDIDGDTILHLAVVGCTIDKVKDLIKICDLDAINNMMQTPLHVATMANRPEMVEILLSSGAKPNIHDRRGNAPLHIACQKGFLEIVRIILDHVCERISIDGFTLEQHLEQTNFEGQTCLHLAAANKKLDIVQLLVDRYNANLNCQDSRSGETILHKAISKFDVDLVAFIVDLKFHCNQADYSNRRPLDTIRILGDSKLDQSQKNKLMMIHELVLKRIGVCIEQNGCCVNIVDNLNDNSSGTSSSSDYSDSDSDVL